jgi:hypothetical protein
MGIYFIQLPAWVFHGGMRVWFRHASVHDHFMNDSHWWPGDLPEPEFKPTSEDVKHAYDGRDKRTTAKNFSKTVKNPKPGRPISLLHPGYAATRHNKGCRNQRLTMKSLLKKKGATNAELKRLFLLKEPTSRVTRLKLKICKQVVKNNPGAFQKIVE